MRGFVSTTAGERLASLAVNGQKAEAIGDDTSFSVAVPEPDFFVGRPWDVMLQATLSSGKVLQRSVRVGPCLDPAKKSDASLIEDDGAPFGEVVRAGEAKTIAFGGAKLDIPAGAVDKDVRITVRPLVPGQVPAMSRGMANVSPDGRAFRFGPHGLKFKKPVSITLPYDRGALGEGMHERHIFSFYYDEPLGKWQRIGRVGGAENGELAGLTEHFTDFVNATLAMPDSPGPASFNPNEMKGIKLGSPSAGIDLIAPPQANSSGAAVMSYPIEVPPGRNGIEPNLAFTYNSERTNGWLGVGWDVPISSIEIDTRFGAASYGDVTGLADRYSLDGEQLTRASGDTYRRRVEGRFEKIERHVEVGSNCVVRWTVTDKSGTVFTYGGVDSDAVLADPDNPCHIFKWGLKRVQDTFGNVMTVTYDHDSGTTDGWDRDPGDHFVDFYPAHIDYTSNVAGVEAAYHVDFVLDTAGARPDIMASGRPGFQQRTRHRLDHIDVRYQNTIIRTYQLAYEQKSQEHFFKSLLHSIGVFGLKPSQRPAQKLDEHVFEYTSNPTSTVANQTGIDAFDPPQSWGTTPTANPLSHTEDWNAGLSGDVGIGFAGIFKLSVGGGGHGGAETTHRALLDLNGDQMPDLVSDGSGGSLNFLRPWLSVSQPSASHLYDQPLLGLESLGHASKLGWSIKGGLEIGPGGASVAYTRTSAEDTTILADANGDGFVDLVTIDNGKVKYAPNDGTNRFGTPLSMTGTLRPVANAADANIQGRATSGFHRVAPLVRWTAPYPGIVTFAGIIKKLQAGGNGLVASIFYNGQQLWQRRILQDDLSECVPTGTDGCSAPGSGGLSIPVGIGDRIYTQLSPYHDPTGPLSQVSLETKFNDTSWDPTITYQVDANKLDLREPHGAYIYRFSQAADHRTVGRPKMTWTAPFECSVQLGANFSKLATSDNVKVSIIKTDGEGKDHELFAQGFGSEATTASVPILLDNVQMAEGEQITFQVESTMPIDPARIQWAPYVIHKSYCKVDRDEKRICGAVSCSSPNPSSPAVCSMQNDPVPSATIPLDVIVQPAQVHFPIAQILGEPMPYVVPSTGSVKIEGSLTVPHGKPPVYVLIQGLHHLYLKAKIGEDVNLPIDLTVQANAGDELFWTVYNEDPSVDADIAGVVRANNNLMPRNFRKRDGLFDRRDDNGLPVDPMAGGYHRWFTGFYNSDLPFEEKKIVFPFTKDGQLWQKPTTFDLAIPHRVDAETSPFPSYFWDGPGKGYIGAGQQNPTRAGSTSAARGSTGLDALKSATTWNLALEAHIAGVGVGTNHGQTNSDNDFFDFNGDRYADAISHDGTVQFNIGDQFIGGSEIPGLDQPEALHRAEHGSVNGHYGADIQLVDSVSTDGSAQKRFSAGFSRGADYGYTTSVIDWVDVNGDGLLDEIERLPNNGADGNQDHPFQVRLNYGYRLGNRIPWKTYTWQQRTVGPRTGEVDTVKVSHINSIIEFFGGDFGVDGIRTQDSGSKSEGQGGGGGSGGTGGSVGAGTTYNVTRTLVDLVDVTGDGLPDQVMKAPNEEYTDGSGRYSVLRVRQNLGDQFDKNELLLKVPLWANENLGKYGFLGTLDDALEMRRAETYSYGFKVEVCFFICIGVSGYYASGSSAAQTAFTDMDGDGQPDMVYKGADALGNPAVFVKRNRIGAVNLLSTVHRPLGGKFTLEYTREGNLVRLDLPQGARKVDEPSNKYVLSKVDLDDGRGSRYAQGIEYEPSGMYGRIDREDFGFAKVTTTLEDGTTQENDYLNQNFYCKGFVAQTFTRDANGALFTSSQVAYADPGNTTTGSFFPRELWRKSKWYEGQTNDPLAPRKSTMEIRSWDDNGNLTDLEVLADEGDGDDVRYHVEYDSTLKSVGIFRPSEVTARGARSTTPLRDRKATYYSNGAIKTLTNVVVGGKDPVTGNPYTGDPATNPTWQFRYDTYGNLQETIDPRGYTLTYGYDDVARTYRTSILDSFGYVSTSVPNYYFGTVDATNDVNKNSTLFRYDDFGRLVRVYGPNDPNTGEPTIEFSYSHQGPGSPLPAYAITAHKDVLHPGDPLLTSTFIDGLDRVIQTKKDIEKDTGTGTVIGMTVSGPVKFDLRGRVQQQGQPLFDTSDASNFVLTAMKNPTSLTYDVLSRPRSVQTPDGGLTTTSYGFATLDGVQRFSTTVRDPNVNAAGGLPGSAKTSYRDVRGLVLAMQESNHLSSGGAPSILMTRYAYNPVDELVQVTDAKGNVTTAEYDTVGRMVSLKSPDAGRTDWSFDRSGNLGSKQTAKLRGAQQALRYHYDFNRLKAIQYPEMPAVTYVYGDASQMGDPAGNRAGRLIAETSEAGTKSYEYDRLGNVVEQRWILNPLLDIPPEETYDRTMSWSYDSFGRLLSMQFPGEEIETVTYGYDRGGNVTRAVGVTPSSGPGGGSTTTPYLNFIGYDEYGQRTRLTAGNGITTSYVYDPLTRRLKEVNADYRDPYLVFRELPPRPMQRLRYAYDPAGNITQMRNDAPFDPDRAMTVAVGTVAQNFAYDDLYQIKTANGVHQEDDPWRITYGLAFSYDAIGNIVQKAQRADHESFFNGQWERDNSINDVTYTADYTYAGPRPHAPTQIVDTLEGAETTKKRLIEYDLDGNQAETRYGSPEWKRALTWDEEDRLKTVVEEDNMQLAKALYDGAGQRAVNLQWLNEESAYFGSNLTLRDGKVPTKHIFAGDTRVASKTGEGPEWVNPSTVVYTHEDHLGSTNYVTSAEQEIVAHEEYLPTGELWVDESNPTVAVGPKYLFTGKELDSATGLYYFGARHYDPRISQWNSPDPILANYMHGQNGGLYNSIHLGLYTYGFNNPVRVVDPDGRDGAWDWMLSKWKAFQRWATPDRSGYDRMKNSGLQHLPNSPALDLTNEVVGATPTVSGIVFLAMAGSLQRAGAQGMAQEGGGAKWMMRDAVGSAFKKGEYSSPHAVMGQCTASSCTATALKSLLQDRGISIPEAEVAEAIGTTSEGTLLRDVPGGLERLGVRGAVVRDGLTMEQLSGIVERNGPTAVGTRIPGVGGHTMIVDKIADGQVFLRDSLPGSPGGAGGSSYSISTQDFGGVWKGTAVDLPKPGASH